MAENTDIEWARSTFNPWIGCSKAGPGCDNCYAERMDARMIFGGAKHWGPGVPRMRTSESNWNKVRQWNRQAKKSGAFWPVFSASLADIFDNEVPDDWRTDFWKLVKECRCLTFIIVTKRIGNALGMLPSDWDNGYPNVRLLITVVNQKEVDRDIPKLLRVPARVRGLSMEPLLETVDLTGKPMSALDWVIVGGESGIGARPMHPDWVRGLRAQCQAVGVPFLFKQFGEWVPTEPVAGVDQGGGMRKDIVRIVKPVGENSGHFHRGDVLMRKVGKKAAGRLLDGVLHDAYPKTGEGHA